MSDLSCSSMNSYGPAVGLRSNVTVSLAPLQAVTSYGVICVVREPPSKPTDATIESGVPAGSIATTATGRGRKTPTTHIIPGTGLPPSR
ncbi:MAG: hypothetical protein ACE5O2_17750 [Armatimonadota bacterium]